MPAPPRIYEYIADDGTIFWSLTKKPSVVSPPTRLMLKDKKGLILGLFVNYLRFQIARPQTSGVESGDRG